MNSTASLPHGLTVRPPEPTDAKGIFDLVSAYNTAVVGLTDCTLGDIADCIVEPGFDRMTDGWLVVGADGLPVGYGTAFGKAGGEMVGIEVTSQDPSVAGWLYERTMRRAQEMGRLGGHTEITVDAFAYRADEPLRTLLSGHGFVTGTTFRRMRIDHTGPVPPPTAPAGVVLRRGVFDDGTRRTAHDVIIECFHDQFGFVQAPHDVWVQFRDTSSLFDWPQLSLLEIDGQAIAVRDCSDAFVETENCGHIAMLGVVEQYRGRGLAKFLLQDAFALDAAAGRTGTILLVDTNNPTPALDLYLSVGMKPTLTFDGWRRVLPVD
jgi:GNAT superfamily N-acetyltransferase